MRLVHITTVPMTLGFLRGQIGVMQHRGFQVHAISSPGEELEAFAAAEDVSVFPAMMSRRITPLQDLGALWKIFRELRRLNPTVVHAHTPKGGMLGMLAALMARVPVRIYHMRGLPLTSATGAKARLLRATETISCWAADRVLCVSHSLRDVAVAEGICPPEKIKVLLGGSGQGVDAMGRFDAGQLPRNARDAAGERLGIPANATTLGFVGRIVRDKGIVELVEAWQALRHEFPDLHLLVVGPFEPQDPVPADVERALREDPRVHLAGMDWNTAPLYGQMALVTLPTYREGFPNVPLEAASMGLPVVATRVPGCVDAVQDGVTGALVPPRDGAALAEAIRIYLCDPELRHRHGRAGRQRVLREFRQEAVWDAIYQEYLSLIRSKGLPVPAGGDSNALSAAD